jgi:hypothetical protein
MQEKHIRIFPIEFSLQKFGFSLVLIAQKLLCPKIKAKDIILEAEREKQLKHHQMKKIGLHLTYLVMQMNQRMYSQK